VVDQFRSWFRENHTLVIFLIAQALALGAAAAAILAYAVKLETRVYTMETRGAEYTVARMEEMKMRITVLEQNQSANAARLERVIDIMTKGQPK